MLRAGYQAGCERKVAQACVIGKQAAAIHDQRLAGDIRAAIAGEQERDFGNFVGLSEMLDGLIFDDLAELGFVVPEIFAQNGLDQAGCDRVDSHAVGSQFQGIGLRHHDERGLGHAVEQAVELWTETGNGRNIDDGAGAALAHAGGHGLNETEGAFQVDLDHLVELGLIHLESRFLGDIGGRIVDQDIDPAELAMGGVDELADVGGAPDVACQGIDPAGAIRDFGGDLLKGLELAAADDDRGAFAGERFRDGSSDAAAGAGDDGDFVCESEGGHLMAASRRRISSMIVREAQNNTAARSRESTGRMSIACWRPTALKASVMRAEPAASAARRAIRSLTLPVSSGPNDAPHRYIAMK